MLPEWNVYVMAAEMALSPNQNSCSKKFDSNFPMDYAAQRRMTREHVCKWPAMKRMVYVIRCNTIAGGLPSLPNFPAPQGP